MPTTSGPSARYSLGQRLDLGEPDLVDLLRRLVGGGVESRSVAAYASSPSSSQLSPQRLVGTGLRQHLVAQDVAVAPPARAYVGLDHRTEPGLPAVDVETRGWRRRPQQRVVGDRRGQQAVELRDGRRPRRTRRRTARPRHPRAAARRARGSSDRRPGTCPTSASATSASGRASIPSRIGIARPGRRRSGRPRTRSGARPATSAVVVASETSTSRVIRCCSSRPSSAIACARVTKSRRAAISRSSASRLDLLEAVRPGGSRRPCAHCVGLASRWCSQ